MTEPRPKARGGLLAMDHSKRGRRFVTVLDPDSRRVALLEPFEHAVLMVCDGRRAPAELSELVGPEVDGVAIDGEQIERCLRFFEREGLIDPLGPRRGEERPPGPKTLARLMAEWTPPGPEVVEHELPPPLSPTEARPRPGLEPTVAKDALRDAVTSPDRRKVELMTTIADVFREAEAALKRRQSGEPEVVEAVLPAEPEPRGDAPRIEVRFEPEELLVPTTVGAPRPRRAAEEDAETVEIVRPIEREPKP